MLSPEQYNHNEISILYGRLRSGKIVRFSIIIPTLNEGPTLGDLAACLAELRGEFEVILADGGSEDSTVQIARGVGWQVVDSPRGRGQQMNRGAGPATGEILLFLHADTRLPFDALGAIEEALRDDTAGGGNFSLRFDGSSREARLLTRIYPLLRLFGMCYGDSAIFVRREIFERIGGYREFPLFEDVDLFKRLKKTGRFVRLPVFATTSSRRFEGRFVRTFALWSMLQALYWIGVPPEQLNRLYRPLR